MANRDIIKSLHGRQVGLGFDSTLVVNTKTGRDQDQEVIGQSITVFVTSAQLLALFTTPVQIIPAPGAGRFILVHKWMAYKPAGTAYSGVAAGEDLTLKYTNASGAQVASPIEATGFLDQATAQTAWATSKGSADNATPASVLAVANAPVMAHMLVGEITTGNTGVFIKVWYDEYPMVLLAD